MSSRSLEAAFVELRDASDGDPIEAAQRAGEMAAEQVRELLAVMEPPSAVRADAFAALLEALERVVAVFEHAARPGGAGRVHAFAVIELLIRSLDRLAPAAAHALTDDDSHVRNAAAQAIRAFTRVPAIAASARRAAERHPDPKIREALTPER